MTATISRPANLGSKPTGNARGGTKHASSPMFCENQLIAAAGDQHPTATKRSDTQETIAVATGPGQATLFDPALDLFALCLDDLEKTRIANANRLAQLVRGEPDSDGVVRGFAVSPDDPQARRLQSIVDGLAALEHEAELNLKRAFRAHPLFPWAKALRGVGEKQAARLLSAVGDPYIRPEMVLPDESIRPAGPRTVSALWAYCGYHVIDGEAPRRRRGARSNWSQSAKTRAYLIAMSCLKQLVKPCHTTDEGAQHVEGCRCSPFRLVYDKRRAHTATTHPEWPPIRSHNDAIRVMTKAILKDLWRAARLHHTGSPDDDP